MSFTMESNRISGILEFIGGGFFLLESPLQYCPTKTRARYMAPMVFEVQHLEYEASLAK